MLHSSDIAAVACSGPETSLDRFRMAIQATELRFILLA
jgi:hypothetical protein